MIATLPLRIAGVLALALVVAGAAAQPLHQEVSVSRAVAALLIIIPTALVPAVLVRYALARRWLPLALLGFAAFAAATALVGLLASTANIKIKPRVDGRAPTQGGPLPGAGQGTTTTPTDVTPDAETVISTPLVIGLLVGLALVVALMIFLAVRRQPAAGPVAAPRDLTPQPRREEIARRFYSLLDDTLDDLRAEPDPRAAVIAAYARMERGLATLGIERISSETPFEYLARVLERLSVSEAAARRLTDLFERAKFSAAPVGEDAKEDAVVALEAIRDEAGAWAA